MLFNVDIDPNNDNFSITMNSVASPIQARLITPPTKPALTPQA